MKKLLLAIFLTAPLLAQEGSNVEPKVPTYTEDEKVMLQAIIILNDQANQACNELTEMKQFKEYYALVKGKIEARYTGYTLNGVQLIAKEKK